MRGHQATTMSLLGLPIHRLDSSPTTLGEITGGRTALLVNVASRCGLTPQYTSLERLHETYADRGFTVVGLPCNQFNSQEPGSADEIAEFCSTTYGVTFPMTEKIAVNGEERHPVYDALVQAPDEQGETGDIRWNFEKFLIDPRGAVVARFGPFIEPDDPRVIEAINTQLTGAGGETTHTPQAATLKGSECTTCGLVGFPASHHCARCATPTAVPKKLSTEGRVWSYTVQRFPPKSPPYIPPAEGFSPFAMGYVELDEGIRIAGILETEDFDDLVGARAELTATEPVPHYRVYPTPATSTPETGKEASA